MLNMMSDRSDTIHFVRYGVLQCKICGEEENVQTVTTTSTKHLDFAKRHSTCIANDHRRASDMTVREHMAALILSGLMTNTSGHGEVMHKHMAVEAVKAADALLAALRPQKKEEPEIPDEVFLRIAAALEGREEEDRLEPKDP